jgi:hypothetical protein
MQLVRARRLAIQGQTTHVVYGRSATRPLLGLRLRIAGASSRLHVIEMMRFGAPGFS